MQDTTLLLSQSNQLYLLSDNHLNSDIKMKKKKNPFLNSIFQLLQWFLLWDKLIMLVLNAFQYQYGLFLWLNMYERS